MNNKLLLTFVLLLIPMASAIFVQNSASTADFNTTLPVSVIVWADSGDLSTIDVTLTSDANVVITPSNVNLGTITTGNNDVANFQLRSDVVGAHSVVANVTHSGGTYLHNFTFTVNAAITSPDFSFVIDSPATAQVSNSFNIVANLTNNGTAAEAGIQITITLPAGASTTYTPSTFTLNAGSKQSQIIPVTASTSGSKSFIVKADGATQYSEETVDVTITSAAPDDLEVKEITYSNAVTGQSATVDATLNNNGLNTETATVNLYVANVLSTSQNITAQGGSTQTISFSHTFVSAGSNSVNVSVNPLVGEGDTSNNNVQSSVSVSSPSSGGGSGGGSSGGGGGGGNYVPTAQAITFKDDLARYSIASGGAVSFSYKGARHTVTVISIRTGDVSLRIESETTLMDLNVGETETAPLDNLGGDDLSVKLNRISFGKADLTFEFIDEQIIEEKDGLEWTKTDTREDVKPTSSSRPTVDSSAMRIVDLDNKGKGLLITLIVLLAILLIGAILFIVLTKTGHIPSDDKKAKAAKRKRLRDKVKKMESEIEETKKQIRKVR